MPGDEQLIKVLVPVGEPFAPDTPESMWAAALDEPDLCELRNVPFDAYGLNWGDVVRVSRAGDGLPEVVEVVRPSGNRTVRVIFNTEVLEAGHIATVLADLEARGATHEHRHAAFYSLDVEAGADYDDVRRVLVEHHDAGRLIFEEAWKGLQNETQPTPDWL